MAIGTEQPREYPAAESKDGDQEVRGIVEKNSH